MKIPFKIHAIFLMAFRDSRTRAKLPPKKERGEEILKRHKSHYSILCIPEQLLLDTLLSKCLQNHHGGSLHFSNQTLSQLKTLMSVTKTEERPKRDKRGLHSGEKWHC